MALAWFASASTAGHFRCTVRLFVLVGLVVVSISARLADSNLTDSDLIEWENNQTEEEDQEQQAPIQIESNKKLLSYKITKLQKCKCGIASQSRIVGGTEARRNEFPWMASVGFIAGSNAYISCGATIINNRYAISAAHCFSDNVDSAWSLIMGHHSINPIDKDAVWIFVDKVIMHPSYNKITQKNDIAILKLENEIDFTNSKLRPICLPGNTANYDNKRSTVAGWGATRYGGSTTKTLRKAEITTLTNTACLSKLRAVGNAPIDPTKLCALTRGKDTCQGDSGGPLMVKHSNGVYHLAGVTSIGIGCAAGYPGIYTRVSKYLPWILKNTADGSFCSGFLPGH